MSWFASSGVICTAGQNSSFAAPSTGWTISVTW